MSGRLGLDFGTSNSVLAVWDEGRGEGVSLHLPDFGRTSIYADERISTVPSLLHYAPADDVGGARLWLGNQVLARNLYHANQTFRWMKRYIINRSPLQKLVNGRKVSPQEAGRDFLSSLLLYAAEELNLGDEEIVLTTPVESFEHYEDWLEQALLDANLPRFRLIDEPSAAALGYGSHIQPGDVYLIFDFGGGTLDVALVLIEHEQDAPPGAAHGRRCRVLGKAGLDLGGVTFDQWLFEEVLKRNRRSDADEEVRQVSNLILVECERVKEALSQHEQAALSVVHPESGAALWAEFTRGQFEELLERKDVFQELDRTIRRALNVGRERGYDEDSIKAVLMVGGSSQIPAIQQTLRRIFGRERVQLNRPLDAIGRGAAAFAAGVDFFDHIQHDYAIRFFNREKGGQDFRVLVGRGAAYPTPEPIARLKVKATYDGQAQLGLAIYEISERRARPQESRVELVFDPSGAARVSTVSTQEEERRTHFWMNEHQPTFLQAEPPAQRGETRFEVEFKIDAHKRLLITARDLQSGQLTHRDYPVVKLS